jgi:predicted dehydrogenase
VFVSVMSAAAADTGFDDIRIDLAVMSNSQETLTEYADPTVDLKVVVYHWLNTQPVPPQFVAPELSLQLLWNYARRIGWRPVVRKVCSRLSEHRRNQKGAGVGVGKVIASSGGADLASGSLVVFFAPNHDLEATVIVVDKDFAVAVESIGKVSEARCHEFPAALGRYVGWSKYSGVYVDRQAVHECLAQYAEGLSVSYADKPLDSVTLVDRIENHAKASDKPSAVLFGLGQYAKTIIIPSVQKHLDLQRVHEIDPLQLNYLRGRRGVSLDTSPLPREGSKHDVWLIAGFHHTHSGLASQGLKDGAAVIVEKPLATTSQQYREFVHTLETTKQPRFWLGFHKRYSQLHSFFCTDTGASAQQPVDMHCIVFEIPLPANHWYNWPVSGSRLISNGCHWIDYFMFVNGYSEVEEMRKSCPRGSDVMVQIRLRNGAYCSMVLTESGSRRLGVRDHIELRVGEFTVSMVDSEFYVSENHRRIIRKARVNPLDAYSRMYEKICESIIRGREGDHVRSLRSTEAVLELEAQR